MEPVGLGIVGLGWWGAVLAESARRTGVARVAACYSRTSDARDEFSREHDCRAAESLDDLLDDPDVDGVLIASPHSTHLDLIARSAEAGKHVFVEKPLALTVADTIRAAEAAEAGDVVLQVGHNRRRQPANRRIKRMIESGELGAVLQLEGTHHAPGGHRPDLPEWRKDPAEAPFGGMTGLGVHTVDTFHYFVGPAARVAAFSSRFVGSLPLDDATTVMIEYGSGPLATINTTYFSPPVVTTAVYGTDASAWNEDDGERLVLHRRGEQTRSRVEVEALDTVADELSEFARCIRDGGEPETGAAAAIEVAAVLEAIGISVAEARAVDIAPLRPPTE